MRLLMRLLKLMRCEDKPPMPSDPSGALQEQAEDSLRQAEQSLARVRTQREEGSLIASTLREIRKENHFREIWENGLRG